MSCCCFARYLSVNKLTSTPRPLMQVQRRLLGTAPTVDSAREPPSEAPFTDLVKPAINSNPEVAAISTAASPTSPAAAPGGKGGQLLAARLAERAALVLVPVAVAAVLAGAARAGGRRKERELARPAGRSPSPANRRTSRSSFNTPREVPFTAPRPFAFTAGK